MLAEVLVVEFLDAGWRFERSSLREKGFLKRGPKSVMEGLSRGRTELSVPSI